MPQNTLTAKVAAFREGLQRFTLNDYLYGEEPYILLIRTARDYTLTDFRVFRTHLMNDAEAKGADPAVVEDRLHIVKKLEDYDNGRTDIVVRKIDEMVADQEHADRIYCLPIACGIGKSTAISLKIREVLESPSPDGLLVITDGTDRMKDYLEPSYDQKLRRFFDTHKAQICSIDKDNVAEEGERAPHCKVLLMTTQRYLQLSEPEIQAFLTWDHGRRTLILVDEEPHLTTVENVDITAMGIVKSALEELLPDSPSFRERKRNCISLWKNVTNHLEGRIKYYHREYKGEKSVCFYDTPARILTDDQEEGFLEAIAKFKGAMIAYQDRQGLKKHNVYNIIRAAFQLMRTGGLFRKRGQRNNVQFDSTFFVLLDFIAQYTVQGPKVIILDGTADVNPEYSLHPECFYTPDLSDYRRTLMNTAIHLINLPTGVGKMKKMDSRTRQALFHDIRQRLGIPKGDQTGRRPVVFTYESVEKRFQREFGPANTAHFGAIHGRNDFRDVNAIAQVGLFAYPLEIYTLYALKLDPQLASHLTELEPLEQSTEIGQLLNQQGSPVKDFMYGRLLTDTIQNLFRGTARNLLCEGYDYFIYYSRSVYPDLQARLQDCFPSPVRIEVIDQPNWFRVEKIMARETDEGPNNTQRVIIAHDEMLAAGQNLFTTSEFREKTGLSESQFKRATDNRTIRDLMSKERVSSRGHYEAKEYWRFPVNALTEEYDEELPPDAEDSWDDDEEECED